MAAHETINVADDQLSPPTTSETTQYEEALSKTTGESLTQQSPMDLASLASGPSAIAQEPLAEFTLFPKLVPELRFAIWKLALPRGPAQDGNRIFRLRIGIYHTPTDPKTLQFSMGVERTSMYSFSDESAADKAREVAIEEGYLADMKDLGLLKACRESRQVFLENAAPYSLPAVNGGKVYFDDSTTLYIEQLDSEDIDMSLTNSKSQKKESPGWFNDIRSVVCPLPQAYGNPYALMSILVEFKGLRSFKFDMEPCCETRRNSDCRRLYDTAASFDENIVTIKKTQRADGDSDYVSPSPPVFKWRCCGERSEERLE